MKYFTSDWHIGHENVIKFSDRPFKSIEAMNQTIIDMVLDTVKKGDEIFFLGDLGYSPEPLERLFKNLPKRVNFNWVIGNHDKKLLSYFKQKCNRIDFIQETVVKIDEEKQRVVMCHYPMLTWNQSHRNAWLLFGHHHINGHGAEILEKLMIGKMFNVNIECNDYQMYDENDIIKIMSKKKDNWDLIKYNGAG